MSRTSSRLERHRAAPAPAYSALTNHTTLPVDSILVGAYQRDLKEPWVRQIVEKFNESLFEPIHVALREDNNYYVVDGQHRLEAARRRGMKTIPVILHLDMQEPGEAQLFVDLQDRRLALTQVARFHASVKAGDPACLRLVESLAYAGFEIAPYTGAADNKFPCPSALLRVQRLFGKHTLQQSLRVVRVAWAGKKDSLKAMIVQGIALYLREHGEVDVDKLAQRLGVLRPGDVILRAAVIRNSMNCSPQRAVAHVIHDVAARGRKPLEGREHE